MMDDHPPVTDALPVSGGGFDALPRVELDYILLAIVVRIQHLRYDEAQRLVDALLVLGERSTEVLMAKAVVENALGNPAQVLATLRQLDLMDPPQFHKGRKVDPRVRMRSFLQAKATFALHGTLDAEGRAALDFYLRQGQGDPDPES
jgi:hypothetical protein